MFMKKVSDMRIVMQRVSFSPESGGVWKPKITWKGKVLRFFLNCAWQKLPKEVKVLSQILALTMLAISTQGPMRLLK